MSNDKRARAAHSSHSEPKPVSVGEFLEDWLQSIASSVRPRTWRRYAEYARLHVPAALGSRPLSTLEPRDLQLLYAERLSKGLSPTSVRHLHRALYRALAQGKRWGLIESNVAELVDPPRPERTEMRTFSPEEAIRFLNAVRSDRLEALYTLAVTTGMRQGELLGLSWRDVDLERRSVKVTASLQYVGGQGLVLSSPKTARSRRNVTVSELAAASLERHRRLQIRERSLAHPRWEDHGLVFANTRGRPIYATNLINRSFAGILYRANLPRIRFHDLRHTTATLLLGQGIHPKVVSEMLGHTNIGITLDLYSHATPTMQREAAAALDKLFDD